MNNCATLNESKRWHSWHSVSDIQHFTSAVSLCVRDTQLSPPSTGSASEKIGINSTTSLAEHGQWLELTNRTARPRASNHRTTASKKAEGGCLRHTQPTPHRTWNRQQNARPGLHRACDRPHPSQEQSSHGRHTSPMDGLSQRSVSTHVALTTA